MCPKREYDQSTDNQDITEEEDAYTPLLDRRLYENACPGAGRLARCFSHDLVSPESKMGHLSSVRLTSGILQTAPEVSPAGIASLIHPHSYSPAQLINERPICKS